MRSLDKEAIEYYKKVPLKVMVVSTIACLVLSFMVILVLSLILSKGVN